MEDIILQPITQYAFAGFCAVLLVIIVWLIKQLLNVIERNNQIIAELSKAITQMQATVVSLNDEFKQTAVAQSMQHTAQMNATYKLRDAMMKLRCIADVDDITP